MTAAYRATADQAGVILDLLHDCFAYMGGVIDPPSSLSRLNVQAVADLARAGQVLCIGTPVMACLFVSQKADALYLGKLAVAKVHRGQGLSRMLIDAAEQQARAMAIGWLELQTRIELLANQAAFAAMGFTQIARTSHPGYARPTTLTFRRKVQTP